MIIETEAQSKAQDLSLETIRKIYQLNLPKLISRAHELHLMNFPHNDIQASSLLSIKTGGCSENCSYCPQSAHYDTGVQKTPLLSVDEVMSEAKSALKNGASRFCMGAAWRQVKDGPEFDRIIEMVSSVKSLGLEVCCTLGMLTKPQAERLKTAGLHAYNHNIDTSENHYSQIISTREYADRLNTIQNVRDSGITVCTGGILGIGESEEDRIAFVQQIASFQPQPESVTINTLVPIPGTPLENAKPVPSLELVRVIATIRITNPRSRIRLSAGRLGLSTEAQFLCFFAGANSIFLGERLLTSPNPEISQDKELIEKCGYHFTERAQEFLV